MADNDVPLTTERPRRGRPPKQEIAVRFAEAVLAVVAERGFTGLTVDAICNRAGVPRTTFYRRWRGAAEAVLEVVSERIIPPDIRDTGNLVDDLVGFACRNAEMLRDPVIAACVAFLQAEARLDAPLSARMHAQLAERRAQNLALIDSLGGPRVLTPEEAGLVIDTIVGLSLFRAATGRPMSPADWRRVIAPLVA